MPNITGLSERVRAGERLSGDEALELYRQAPTALLGRLADAVRARKHPGGIVTYIIDRNVNYTNVCVAKCNFCAFYRPVGSPEGYVLGFDELFRKIDETIAVGGVQLLLQGGHNPDLPLTWYEDLFRAIKARYPAFKLHALSPPEVIHLSRLSQLAVPAVIDRLIAAGLDSIPGGGAEILVDRVRKLLHCYGKATADEWLDVMRHAPRARRERHGQRHDRRKRRPRRRCRILHGRSRDRAQHRGRRLRPEAPQHALRDSGRSDLPRARRAAHARARDRARRRRHQRTRRADELSGSEPRSQTTSHHPELIHYHARWIVSVSDPPMRDGWITVDGGRVAAVTRRAPANGGQQIDLGEVAVMPGLVNAHTHLELSYLRDEVPPASEFVTWIRDVMAARRRRPDPQSPEILDSIDRALAEASACGTAIVGDISNTLVSFAPLTRSSLAAVVFYELIRFHVDDPQTFVDTAWEELNRLVPTDRARAPPA